MILRGEDESLVSFFWKGNDRLVFLADVGGNESFFIGSSDLNGRSVLRLAESQRIEDNLVGNVANILDELPGDPQRILVAGYFAENIDHAMFLGGAAVVARLNVFNRARSPVLEFKESDRNVLLLGDNLGALRVRGRLVGREVEVGVQQRRIGLDEMHEEILHPVDFGFVRLDIRCPGHPAEVQRWRVKAEKIRACIRIVLVKVDGGCVVQHLLDGHTLETAAFQLGNVLRR